MSIENVKAFYKRLASDQIFRTQIQSVKSKAECTKIVREAGYYFTSQEYEEYTAELLESGASNSELEDLDEKQLEAVIGGASSILGILVHAQPKYGVVRPTFPILMKP